MDSETAAVKEALDQLSLYKDFLVPLGAACLGGLFSIAAGLFVVTRTEAYRRLSRWEPYAESLWSIRIEKYVELLSTLRNLETATFSYCLVLPGESRSNSDPACVRLKDEFLRAAASLDEVTSVVISLMDGSTFDKLSKVTGKLRYVGERFMIKNETTKATDADFFKEFSELHFELINAIRTELHVDKLSEEGRKMIEKALESSQRA